VKRTRREISSDSADIGPVFDRLADQRRVQALLVANDPLFITERVQLAKLAARYAVPGFIRSVSTSKRGA